MDKREYSTFNIDAVVGNKFLVIINNEIKQTVVDDIFLIPKMEIK